MNNFILTKFKNFAKINAGQSPESIYYSDSEGTPFLQGNRTFGILYPEIDTYTKKITKMASSGDILMSVRAPVGDLNFANRDICIGRGIASIKANDGNNHFLFYCLKYNIQNLIRQGSGTTYDSVNKDIINNFDLIMPKHLRTRQIIGKILSDLDAKIELNNKINAELEVMAKTLYDYWFVQFDFPNEEGKPYKSSGGKMVFNEELKREIPDGWEVGELKEIANITTGKLDSNAEVPNGKYPFYTCASEPTKTDSFAFDDTVILIAGNNAAGNFHINRYKGKFNAYQRTYITTAKNIVDLEYLYQVLKTETKLLKSQGKGSQTKFLTIGMLTGIKVFKSNSTTMKNFNDLVNPMFEQQIIVKKENQELVSLRDWLLPMLMNGQISVGEVEEQLGMVAEPSDEYKKN